MRHIIKLTVTEKHGVANIKTLMALKDSDIVYLNGHYLGTFKELKEHDAYVGPGARIDIYEDENDEHSIRYPR